MSKTTLFENKIFIDKETGEEVSSTVVYKKHDVMDRKGWRRVILTELMTAIDQIGNKKIKVLEFIIENIDNKNFFKYTQDEVVMKTGISKPTVNETFKGLVACKFLTKVRHGYALNCNVVGVYGSNELNIMVRSQYEQENLQVTKNSTDIEQEIKITEKKMARLKKQLEQKQTLESKLAAQNYDVADERLSA